ncbi:Uncharacterised protein [Chlamydia trachomatis]|nr:Uncharacterised protein [Chlamydia trachomatis]
MYPHYRQEALQLPYECNAYILFYLAVRHLDLSEKRTPGLKHALSLCLFSPTRRKKCSIQDGVKGSL